MNSMGVSFKIAKKGKRYTPKGGLGKTENDIPEVEELEARQGDQAVGRHTSVPSSSDLRKSGSLLNPDDFEVSFSLNLFPNGFFVGNHNELIQDVPQYLLPYDRQAEMIFSDIEHGRIPGDLFDSLPCKYVNGAIACEVRDYRTAFKEGENPSSPKIDKVILKMGMEQVIKDISFLADDTWTYTKFLEMEGQVLKALNPVLNLNPKLTLDGFQECHPTKKLEFGISQERKRRRLVGEFPQQQLSASQVGTSVSSEVHQEKAEILQGSNVSHRPPLPLPSPSPLPLPSSSGQQAIFEFDPLCSAGLTALEVNEQVNFGEMASSDAGKRKDGVNASELPQLQPKRPSPRVRARAPSTQGQAKKSGQSRPRNKKENNSRGNEAMTTSQFAMVPAKVATTPTRGNTKSSVHNSSKNRMASPTTTSPEVGMNRVESRAMTSHEIGAMTMANVVEMSVPCSSAAIDPVLCSLSNIIKVSESRGLHISKQKDCWLDDNRPLFGPPSLVASHLQNAEDNTGTSHHAAGPLSNNSDVCKSSTFKFLHVSWRIVSQDMIIKIENRTQLILRERIYKEHPEACIFLQSEGHGEIHIFNNIDSAKLFALQFMSLMNREGYILVDRQDESIPLNQRSDQRGAFELPRLPLPLPPSTTWRYPRPPTGTISPSASNLSRDNANVQAGLPHSGVLHSHTTQLHPISQQHHQQQHLMNTERIRHQIAQRNLAMEGSGRRLAGQSYNGSHPNSSARSVGSV